MDLTNQQSLVDTAVEVDYETNSAALKLMMKINYRHGANYAIPSTRRESAYITKIKEDGDKDELNRHNILCNQDLPGVGKNLQDHIMMRQVNKVKNI